MDFSKYREQLQSNINQSGGDLLLKKQIDPQKKGYISKEIQAFLDTLPSSEFFLADAKVTQNEDSVVLIGHAKGNWNLPGVQGGKVIFDDDQASFKLSYDLEFQKEKVELVINSDFTFGIVTYPSITKYTIRYDGQSIWQVEPTLLTESIPFLGALKLVAPSNIAAVLPPNVPTFSSMGITKTGPIQGQVLVEFSPIAKTGELVQLGASTDTSLALVKDKAFIKGVSLQLRVGKETLDLDGDQIAPSSFEGILTGRLKVGEKDFEVSIYVTPFGMNLLEINEGENGALPTLPDLAGLIGGDSLKENVQKGVKALKLDHFVLTQVKVGIDPNKSKIEYSSFLAEVNLADIQFQVSARVPNFEFSGTMRPGDKIDLKKLLEKFFGESKGFPTTEITSIFVYAQPGKKSYRLNISIETSIAYIIDSGGSQNSISLEKIELDINKKDKTVGGRISCVTNLFGTEIQLSLERFDKDSGWVISGSSLPSSIIPVGILIDDAMSFFSLPIALPDELSQTQLEDTLFDFNSKTKSISFSSVMKASEKWEIPIGPTGLIIDRIAFSYQKEKLTKEEIEANKSLSDDKKLREIEGSVSGEATIAGAKIDLLYRIPGSLVLKSKIPELSFSALADQFGDDGILSDFPLPSSFFDFTLKDVEIFIEPEKKAMSLSANVDGFGKTSVTFVKQAGKWGLLLEFTLSKDFSFSKIHSDLSIMDVVNLGGGKLIFSSFTTAPGKEISVAGASLSVQKGVNIFFPADLFKMQALSFLNTFIGGGGGQGGNPPLITGGITPDGGIKMQAALPAFSIISGLDLEKVGVRFESSALGLKTGVFAQLELGIDSPPLFFEVSVNAEPTGTEVRGFLAAWETPFGIQGINLYDLRLIVGTNLAGVPTIGMTGRGNIAAIEGSCAFLFDSKNPTRSMFALKLNELGYGTLMEALFSPVMALPAPIVELANIVLFRDLDFRVVPPGVEFPEFKKGISVDGKVEIGFGPLKLKGRSEGVAEIPKGAFFKGSIDPIDLGPVLQVKGQGNEGPTFEVNLLLADLNPSIKLNASISFLGMSGQSADVFITAREMSFKFVNQLKLATYTLECQVSDVLNITASGKFEFGLDLEVPDLEIEIADFNFFIIPAFRIKAGLSAGIQIKTVVDSDPSIGIKLIETGFDVDLPGVGKRSVSIPEIGLTVSASDFSSIPTLVQDYILDNIEEIILAVLSPSLSIPPIEIDGILAINGVASDGNPEGGPSVSLDLTNGIDDPKALLEGSVSLFGLPGDKVRASLTNDDLSFHFRKTAFPTTYELECHVVDMVEVTAAGTFLLDLDILVPAFEVDIFGITFPLWPNFPLSDTQLKATIEMYAEASSDPSLSVSLVDTGFAFSMFGLPKQAFTVPDISLEISSGDFGSLHKELLSIGEEVGQHILDNLEEVFTDFRIKVDIDPIGINGIFMIHGSNPSDGPNFEVNLSIQDKDPKAVLDGGLSLLGLEVASARAHVSKDELSFRVKQNIGIANYDLGFKTTNFKDLTASGAFEVDIDLDIPDSFGFDIPLIPALPIDINLSAATILSASIDQAKMGVAFEALSFSGIGGEFKYDGKIALEVNANDLSSLGNSFKDFILDPDNIADILAGFSIEIDIPKIEMGNILKISGPIDGPNFKFKIPSSSPIPEASLHGEFSLLGVVGTDIDAEISSGKISFEIEQELGPAEATLKCEVVDGTKVNVEGNLSLDFDLDVPDSFGFDIPIIPALPVHMNMSATLGAEIDISNPEITIHLSDVGFRAPGIDFKLGDGIELTIKANDFSSFGNSLKDFILAPENIKRILTGLALELSLPKIHMGNILEISGPSGGPQLKFGIPSSSIPEASLHGKAALLGVVGTDIDAELSSSKISFEIEQDLGPASATLKCEVLDGSAINIIGNIELDFELDVPDSFGFDIPILPALPFDMSMSATLATKVNVGSPEISVSLSNIAFSAPGVDFKFGDGIRLKVKANDFSSFGNLLKNFILAPENIKKVLAGLALELSLPKVQMGDILEISGPSGGPKLKFKIPSSNIPEASLHGKFALLGVVGTNIDADLSPSKISFEIEQDLGPASATLKCEVINGTAIGVQGNIELGFELDVPDSFGFDVPILPSVPIDMKMTASLGTIINVGSPEITIKLDDVVFEGPGIDLQFADGIELSIKANDFSSLGNSLKDFILDPDNIRTILAGLAVKVEIPKVDVGGLISITGDGGGPTLELKNNGVPEAKLSGDIDLFGMDVSSTQAEISAKRITFKVAQSLGLARFALDCGFSNKTDFNAAGTIALGLNVRIPGKNISVAGISVPVWPSFTLDEELSATVRIKQSGSKFRITLTGLGFSWSGHDFTVPDITLAIGATGLASLPEDIGKHILNNIDDIFRELIEEAINITGITLDDLKDFAEDTLKQIVEIDDLGKKAADVVATQATEVFNQAEDIIRNIDDLDKQAEAAARFALDRAEEILDLGNSIVDLGDDIADLALDQVNDIRNIGSKLAEQAGRFASTAVNLLKDIASFLNPANWF